MYYAAPPSFTNGYSETPKDYSTICAAGNGSGSSKIGTFYGAGCSGQYDWCSIKRTAGTMSNLQYNGITAKYIGGCPTVNATVRFTGIANRNTKGTGSSAYGKCNSINVSYESLDGTKITNGIRMKISSRANTGSSSAPLTYLDDTSDSSSVIITGIASKPDNKNNYVYFTKVSVLISKYNLTPVGLKLIK